MKAQSKCILIVEDDFGLRSMMRRQLESGGYAVVEADDGAQVLDLLASEEIDLVISDVVMDVRGGIHVARDIRKTRPEMPILFVTGALSVNAGPLRDVANELGVHQIVAKPYDADDLLKAIAAAFESPGNRL